MIFNQILSPSK